MVDANIRFAASVDASLTGVHRPRHHSPIQLERWIGKTCYFGRPDPLDALWFKALPDFGHRFSFRDFAKRGLEQFGFYRFWAPFPHCELHMFLCLSYFPLYILTKTMRRFAIVFGPVISPLLVPSLHVIIKAGPYRWLTPSLPVNFLSLGASFFALRNSGAAAGCTVADATTPSPRTRPPMAEPQYPVSRSHLERLPFVSLTSGRPPQRRRNHPDAGLDHQQHARPGASRPGTNAHLKARHTHGHDQKTRSTARTQTRRNHDEKTENEKHPAQGRGRSQLEDRDGRPDGRQN